MLIVISPAKSLSAQTPKVSIAPTIPAFLQQSKKLVDQLKKLSVAELQELMAISPKLAELNWQRFNNFALPFNQKNSHPALFLFDGDVYQAMKIAGYNQADLEFAQRHLRILSGLYGILKPLDLMQDYRLEMGTNIKKIFGQNLPQFWQEKIANFCNDELSKQAEKIIINLASSEYFAAINPAKIKAEIVNIIFKEKQGDDYKTIGLFAKKARGLMADFIIKNKIEKAADLKDFAVEKYRFRKEFSDQNNWSFYR